VINQNIISLTDLTASRFYTRWLNAETERAGMVTNLAKLSMSKAIFVEVLQNETAAGKSLPRAMRRLRNLVVTTLIERDLTGHADLAEVVETMTIFAEFAVQTHLAALMVDMIAEYGTPIGEESGVQQELIVLGMGKLGGGELNVSSDIDVQFLYSASDMPPRPEDTNTTPVRSSEARYLRDAPSSVRVVPCTMP